MQQRLARSKAYVAAVKEVISTRKSGWEHCVSLSQKGEARADLRRWLQNSYIARNQVARVCITPERLPQTQAVSWFQATGKAARSL